jgi:hypothetical protein
MEVYNFSIGALQNVIELIFGTKCRAYLPARIAYDVISFLTIEENGQLADNSHQLFDLCLFRIELSVSFELRKRLEIR